MCWLPYKVVAGMVGWVASYKDPTTAQFPPQIWEMGLSSIFMTLISLSLFKIGKVWSSFYTSTNLALLFQTKNEEAHFRPLSLPSKWNPHGDQNLTFDFSLCSYFIGQKEKKKDIKEKKIVICRGPIRIHEIQVQFQSGVHGNICLHNKR